MALLKLGWNLPTHDSPLQVATWLVVFSSPNLIGVTYVQYCAKVMRVKCANFVLCLCKISKKVHPKIQASFCNVLSVISLKQRTKICGIFKTRTTIPYLQRDNSACSMRNIAVQCTDKYWAINVSFSCEQTAVTLTLYSSIKVAVVNVLIRLSWQRT